MYMYTYAHTSLCIHTYSHTSLYVRTHVHVHVCTHKPMHTHIRTHKPMRTHILTHKPIYAYMCAAKVRETFWRLICPYPLRDRQVVVGGRWSSQPWLGPSLVQVVCASPGLFRLLYNRQDKRNTLISYLSLSAS